MTDARRYVAVSVVISAVHRYRSPQSSGGERTAELHARRRGQDAQDRRQGEPGAVGQSCCCCLLFRGWFPSCTLRQAG